MISVVVPAYNEERGISRCLDALVQGRQPGELEIIVVANGCTDATVERARTHGPAVTVLELGEASKTAALNAGDALAQGFPRFYVDGDVVVTLEDLRHVAEPLLSGAALLAAPARVWDVEGRPWVVRSYLRFVWHLPQVQASVVGGGVLGVSERGRRRFDVFPEVLGDDLFLESRFAAHERCVVAHARSNVEMPWNLGGLLARRTRVVLANRQDRERAGTTQEAGGARLRNVLLALRARPSLIADLPVFLAVTLVAESRARLAIRRGRSSWQRDESTR